MCVIDNLFNDLNTDLIMYCIIQCKLNIFTSILTFTFYNINQICHTILEFSTRVLEQPASKCFERNVMTIR